MFIEHTAVLTLDMGIVMIESETEKLRSIMADDWTKRIEKQIKLLVSLMREKKLEEGSRLNYLISEVVEMVREVQRCYEIHTQFCWSCICSTVDMLKKTNIRLREEGWRSEEDGVWEEEGERDVVGLQEDAKLLADKIYKSELYLFIASITGIVGSGKTTLAKLVYNHAYISHKFELCIWVNCRKIISRKEFFINIIQQTVGGHVPAEEMKLDDFEEMLSQQLDDKRFFIVLDHIDGSKDWINYIKYSKGFAPTKLGRVLLITSSTAHDATNYDHRMKNLDVDKSWQLLLKSMLRMHSDVKFPKQVEKKGKLVLMKHTGGLPLAIKEAAMEWVEKRRQGIQWEDIVHSDDLKLRATLQALNSRFYHKLEPDKKSIFLHLGLFKLGESIVQRKFKHTFVASGVLNSSLFDYYCEYFKSAEIIEYKDKVVHVSPIYHKLSIMKAKKGNDGAHLGVIICRRERFNGSIDQNEGQLICVSFRGGGCLDASPSYWQCFEKLRVLDFEGFGLRFLPETVGELIQLRYLGLRNNYIQELPRRLCNLKKLEVLDIAHNFMVKVPDIIREMDALVHLYMSDIFCMKPLEIETLKNLETLTYISIDNWSYKVSGLGRMTVLSKLGIEEVDENSDVSKLFASLAALQSLHCLVLRGFPFRSMPSLNGIGVLRHLTKLKLVGLIPELPNFPPNLYSLTLINSCLEEDPMPILEILSNLCTLKLRNSYTGQQMVISKFPSLRVMCIEELWHLRSIQLGQDALSDLWKLEIIQYPYLHSLPKEMIAKCRRFEMVTTKNIKTDLMKCNILSDTDYMDIQP